jgi:hypothetical protein
MDPQEHNVCRKSRRKRFRCSLRTFLCVFTLLCIAIGFLGNRVHQQHRALSWASRNGAEVVTYLPTDLQDKPTWLVAILLAFFDPAPTVVFENVAAVDLGPLAGSRLSSVAVYGSALDGLSALQHVHALESAYLKKVTVKDWSGVVLPPTLIGFGAVDCDLCDITFLSGLVKLDGLILERTAVQDLSPLKGLAHLTSIELDGSPVSDLSPLAEVTNLQYLDLSRTSVSDLAPLQGLKYLQSLHLTETCIRDISAIRDLVLVHLDLSFTEVSEISVLAEQKYLYSLGLSGTRIDDLAALKEIHSLRRLDLRAAEVSSLPPLASLRSLRDLDLSCTRMSDVSPLLNMPNLEYLNLSGSAVSDVSTLLKITNLRWLNLKGTQISEDSFHTLRATLPNCMILADFPIAERGYP